MSCQGCEQVMERLQRAEQDVKALSLENALLKHDLEQWQANCTGKHGSQCQCYSASGGDSDG